jgi:beta-lactamase class A
VKSLFKFLIFITIVLALIFIPIIVYYISLLQEKDRIRQQVLALSTIAKPAEAQRESILGDLVSEHFSKYGTDYAVVIKNLKTGEEYKFNENKKFNSASLYKLWVMGVAFQKIKEGTLKEDQVLSSSVKILDNTLSAASPTPTPEGFREIESAESKRVVTMTLKDALDRMIINSDNYSALLVASKSGTFSVTNFLKTYNLNDSSFRSPPQTTANDTALFYEKLYKGEIVDKNYSSQMMEILKRQAINDRLPKYLPRGTTVAHKTGELNGAKHDAGIVFSDSGDYIIVVLSNTKDPVVAAENIANFSKEIFAYFNSVN